MYAPLFSLALAVVNPQEPSLPPVPTHALRRVEQDETPPVIDGLVDDEFWQRVEPLGGFRQVVPIAGAEPSEATELRLAYDDTTLYLALICFDREPALIRDSQMVRDANLDPDDRVEILIDPFLDRRNAFWFQIGPGGSIGDALVSRNGGAFNKQWDGIWEGQSRVTERGWEAEIAIPMATLNFDPNGSAWGFNARRLIRRRTEEVRWATPTPRIRFFSVANAGTLTGLHDLRQGIGLDVVPFVVTELDRDRTTGAEDSSIDAGFDAFYKLTPNTKLSFSLNTDFAQTEVDARRVNLTRFPLFFPEKRDFFLEDSGAFVFGSAGDVLPFFSRRIGLNNGAEVPLSTALKLTGRTNSYGFGIMNVQTDDTSSSDGENLLVGRFTKNIYERSSVGAIWTSGDPGGGGGDTFGMDFNLQTDTFRGNRNLQFSGYFLRSRAQGGSEDDQAYRARIAYPNDELDLSLSALVVEDNFDPKLGFVARTGIKRYDGRFRYRPRLNSTVRQLRFSFQPTLVTNIADETETLSLFFQVLGLQFESDDVLSFSVDQRTENLDADFDITPGVTVPVGDYGFTRLRAFFQSSDKRPFSLQSSISTGTFFDGDRDELGLQLDWRASKFAQVGLEWEYNDVRLPGGDFDFNLARLRLTLAGSPELSWTNFIQFDDMSHNLGLNSRMWWIPTPGREVFLVLNQGWIATSDSLYGTGTNLAFKVGYTLRF